MAEEPKGWWNFPHSLKIRGKIPCCPCGGSLLSLLVYLCKCEQTDGSLPVLKELMGKMAQEWDRGDLFLYQPKKCFNVKRTSWLCTWVRQALNWNEVLQVVSGCTSISHCCPSVCPAACPVPWAVQSLCCWLRHDPAENHQGWQSQHFQVVQSTDTGSCCSALEPVTVKRQSEVVTRCLDLVSRGWTCALPARMEQLCNRETVHIVCKRGWSCWDTEVQQELCALSLACLGTELRMMCSQYCLVGEILGC